MSFISSVMVSIIAIIVFISTLSIKGVLKCNSPPPQTSHYSVIIDDDIEDLGFEPIDNLDPDSE